MPPIVQLATESTKIKTYKIKTYKALRHRGTEEHFVLLPLLCAFVPLCLCAKNSDLINLDNP
jgi:hypothetical protein